MITIEQIKNKLITAGPYLKKFEIIAIYVFGSVARQDATAESDLDILIELDPNHSVDMFLFMELNEYLENLFLCKVDLVTKDALHYYIKDEILEESIRVA